MYRCVRPIGLALVVALQTVAASCGRVGHDQQQSAASDSITLRVFNKGCGSGETAECNSDEWGWDSVTVRLAKGDTAAIGRGSFSEVHLQLVRAMSADSVLVAYSPREISVVASTEKGWV